MNEDKKDLLFDITAMVRIVCNDPYCTRANEEGHTHLVRKQGFIVGETIFDALKKIETPTEKVIDIVNSKYIGESNVWNRTS